MRTLYLITVVFFCCSKMFSQEYVFGLKGGLNTNTIGDIYERPYQGDPGITYQPEKDMGYLLGAYFMVEFNKFFIRPELNYVSLKNHYDFSRKKANWRTSKMEVPLLFGVKILKPVAIYVGPSFNFYDETILDGVQETTFSDGGPDLDRKTTSLNFGIMARYNRFSLDLRYEVTSKKTEEELLDIINSEYGVNLADLRSYKHKILSLSISIDIFRTDGTKLSDIFKSNKYCGCPY
ncbi:hypothetical protein CSW08_07110 [Confluentibacter flavum]|uniref:Uncharacterized protein n=2 Tax=Confluentibacter flavum TaxID=1909700 RepID=A0A2N3HL66_9FLAO|nr:hypothetical protein CSW08_07110 [Confluentibacter flavum]